VHGRPRTTLLIALCVVAAGSLDRGGGRTAAQSTAAALPDWSVPIARTDTGLVRGTWLDPGRGVRRFAGIPYAAPPTGDHRWQAPAPVEAWRGARDATAFGPACSQPTDLPFAARLGPVASTYSEDCLTLNVWTPADSPSARLPVMVWIHGGAFLVGASSQPVYDGESLARRGVVVVSLNYRLGPFGFLAHPALSRQSRTSSSGNYGLLDQVAALKWVQRNVGSFGGDPSRVTLFGESAGAVSVNLLLVSPSARGLFHRAILQSGTALGRVQHLSEGWYFQPPAEEVGRRVAAAAKAAEADPLAALRSLAPEALLAAARPQMPFSAAGNPFYPIVDGAVVPDEPALLMEHGEFARVPVIVGANADEGSLFAQAVGGASLAGYRMVAATAYPRHAAQVLARFPASTDEEARKAAADSLTAVAFTAPARRLAREVARAGAKAYVYDFTRVRPGSAGERWGAFHGAEVPFVFGTLTSRSVEGFGDLEVGPRDRDLSDEMAAAWVRFAATGDPNGPGAPPWPAYDPETRTVMEFGQAATAARRDPCAETCDLFDAIARDWQTRKVTARK
jgi:para-nitrobenzyl esterase